MGRLRDELRGHGPGPGIGHGRPAGRAVPPAPPSWQYFAQRPLVSDPNLLAGVSADPLQLNPEQSPAGDAWRIAIVPAFYDRREVPQQRTYYDPSLLGTPLLENELLGGAETGKFCRTPATHADRREVPQQRAYYDLTLLASAELENELLGGAQTPRTYGTPSTHYPRWWMPQQPARLADPLLIQTAELENGLLGGADTARHYLAAAYCDRREVPQQRLYVSDPLLLTTAELENELLGGGDTARHWLPAAFTDRREYPYQPKRDAYTPGLLDQALLENELLGGAQNPRTYDTAATHADRREAPQQRAYLSDPSFYPAAAAPANGSDVTEAWWGTDTDAFYHVQKILISDPSLLAPPLGLDPTLAAWPRQWLTISVAVTHADRRDVPQQRAYLSDPSFYPSEVEIGAGTTEAWWGADTDAFYGYQKILVSDPSILAPPAVLDPPSPRGCRYGSRITLPPPAPTGGKYRSSAAMSATPCC